MNLEYKWVYDDLLIFKNQNDCMTISRNNNLSTIEITSIEVDGEKLEEDEDCYYNIRYHSNNPFTQDEMEYYLEFYQKEINL